MAPQSGFWDRVQDQVRTGYERTRRGTNRAVRMGMLRVDLLSLRRDRTRALAQLGERAFALWTAGSLGLFEADAEALRVRSLLEGVERCITSKEEELESLRQQTEEVKEPEAGGHGSPQMEGTNGIS